MPTDALRANGSRRSRLRGAAAAQTGRAGLLAGARVTVQGAALDRLVDRAYELAMLGVGGGLIATGDGGLQPAEVGLDLGGVAAVLQALTLGAQDPLLLGMNVG